MKNYKKHIDDFFKEKLGRYTETPPPDVWDALEGRLDTLVPQPNTIPTSSYRWLKHFGMISMVAILTVSMVRKISGNAVAGDSKAIEETTVLNTANAKESIPTVAEKSGHNREHAKPNELLADNKLQHTTPSTIETKATIRPSSTPVLTSAKNTVHNTSNTITKQYNRNLSAKATASSKNNQGLKGTTGPIVTNNKYHGNLSNPAPEEVVGGNDNNTFVYSSAANTTLNAQNELVANDKKKTEVKENELTENKKENEKKSTKHELSKFEMGIKFGYEKGFNDIGSKKYLVSPYVQYNLNAKFSVMSQPAIKYATLTNRSIGKPQSYYKVNDDGSIKKGTSQIGYIFEGSSIKDSTFTTNYRYTQSHDSTVKTYIYGGSYLEFELPVLLKYNIGSKVAVYGGVNINYSKLVSVTEKSKTYSGIVKSADSTNTSFSTATPLNISDVITYTGTAAADYKGPTYATGSMVRFGYMAGISYNYSDRWLVDALIQQTPVKGYKPAGYNTNSSLSAPYFRLSVGYKLKK